jgi:hypothetical protein
MGFSKDESGPQNWKVEPDGGLFGITMNSAKPDDFIFWDCRYPLI